MTDHAEQYVAAIDQGTTSSRCIIFDREGAIVAVDRREHRQIVPQPGWVEHDAAEIWAKVRAVVAGALARAGLRAGQISALGVTNQRETTVLWDRVTGKPVHNAIVRQDTRTAALCAELGGPDGQDRFRARIRARTGLPLAGCFSGPKAAWLLDRVPGLRARAERGEIAFGTVDSWLVWNLTGGTDGGRHVTDVTNAGRTLLMDLETRQWDPSLLSAMDVPEAVLPEIRPSAEVYGTAVGVLDGVPVAASLGDQQAALFGQACYDVGTAKNTYGTESSLLLNTGNRPVASKHGLLTTVGYRIGGEAPVYCLEGSLATTDALVTREVVDAMQQDSGVRITTLKVDGGMTRNDLLMQHQADVLGVPVVRPRVSETTCMGAYAAGLATGVWSDLDELAAHWQQDAEWTPAVEASVRDREHHHWRRAVERSFGRIEDTP
ncbi:FGGY family carbohydrate kinase [Streptomyces longwoodensis]|uniref:FGGY family carbohydrate kinase n=1 Tax=Streptomyces longwoodensis TaxID=68231 RepID=UPI0036F701F2